MEEMESTIEMIKQFGQLIKQETIRASKEMCATSKVQKVDPDLLRAACAYLGEDILGKLILKRELQGLKSYRQRIKSLLPNGVRVCPSIVPTTDMGSILQREEISRTAYYFNLIRSSVDGLTYNFSGTPGCYFEVLPEEITRPVSQGGCAIEINYENPEEDLASDDDFKKIYNAYIDAYNNLRGFFGLKPYVDFPKI